MIRDKRSIIKRNEKIRLIGEVNKNYASIGRIFNLDKGMVRRIILANIVDVSEKKCNRCNALKPIEEFNMDKYSVDGHMLFCRQCHGIGYLNNEEREKLRELNRINSKQYRKNYPELASKRDRHNRLSRKDTPQYKCGELLRYAVRSSKINRPSICSECGKEGVTQAHHEDYTEPFDVVWLCAMCHGKKHGRYQIWI